MRYLVVENAVIEFRSGNNKLITVPVGAFVDAIIDAHKVIDQISDFKVNIFEILGMRNLSSFIGELFAASFIIVTGTKFRKNPHQDGYPDLLLMDDLGRRAYENLERHNHLQDKAPFSPFRNGGIEIKATVGSIPTPAKCRKLGLPHKPRIGDQRINILRGYDWKAHHRETNNLAGLFWDFIGNVPRITAIFFCSTLDENDWGKIIQPKKGGGRTTSVSIMTRQGVRKMYENWILVYDEDPKYKKFLNRYNNGDLIP